MTITHPHHPLYGQQVELVRLRRGADPDLIIRAPDSTHLAVAMSLTDYAGLTEPPVSELSSRLALAGLRQVVQLMDQWQQQRR